MSGRDVPGPVHRMDRLPLLVRRPARHADGRLRRDRLLGKELADQAAFGNVATGGSLPASLVAMGEAPGKIARVLALAIGWRVGGRSGTRGSLPRVTVIPVDVEAYAHGECQHVDGQHPNRD